MDFIKAVSIIRKDLDEVSALLDQLSLTPGAQVAEIELARSRVHSATEMLKLLPQLNEAPVPKQANLAEAVAQVQPVAAHLPKAVAEAEAEAKPEVMAEVQQAARQEAKAEVKTGEKIEVKAAAKVEAKTAARPEAKHEVKTEVAAEKGKPILADKFSAAETIGEKVSSVKQDEVITSVLHNKPISDIAAAIGINDKFYYIRELFSGDSRAYHDTLQRLNSSASLGEAMKILDENTVMGSDPAAQSSFVDIVRRKFNINV
jgi:hypothetical protein